MRSRILRARWLWLVASALGAPPLLAQTVTSTADSGPGSLRETLDTAQPGALISFDLGAGPNPVITQPDGADPWVAGVDGVIVDGRGAPGLTLSGTRSSDAAPLPVILQLDAGGADDTLEFVDVNQRTGIVELDGTLVYRTTQETTLDVDITDLAGGSGALVKEGPASLLLLGDNSFSGAITLREGTLQGPSAAFPGDVENGGSLVFDEPLADPPAPGLFSGLISDLVPAMGDPVPGRVTKRGDGELRFDGGAHSYTGGTRIEAGRLVLEAGTTLDSAGSVAVEGPGTLELELDPASTVTLDGALSGSGRFEVEGGDASSVLELNSGGFSGAFAFTGGGATVRDAGGVLEGAIDFGSSGGVLEVLGDATLGGDLTGTGTLRSDPAAGGGDLVTLNGANSHTQTEVLSGTLAGDPASLVGSIDNAGALRVRPAGATPFGAAVGGAGSFEKTAAGSLRIVVDQAYTGATRVSQGVLELAADLQGTTSIDVDAGAGLAGFGDAPAAALAVQGQLDPSDPADPILVSSASFAPGSSLRMDVADDGSADLLQAAGDVDAAGADLELRIAAGDYTGGVTATLLRSTGGSLSAPAFADSFPFLTITPQTLGGEFRVNISGDLGDVGALARTPGQRALAAHLQPQLDDGTGGFDAVSDAFFSLPSESAVRRAFDSMSGESITALLGATLTATQRLDRTLHRRGRGPSRRSQRALWELGEAGALSASNALSATNALGGAFHASRRGPELWLDLWGGFGSHDESSAADVEQVLGGVFLGGSLPLGPLQVGAAAGYSYADLELDGIRADTSSHAAHAALSAAYAGPLGYLSAAGRYVHARNRSDRRIALAGFGSADADFDTEGGGAGLEAGLRLARLGIFGLEALGSFDWTRLRRDSFRESGAGALNLQVAGERIDSLRSGLGLRLQAAWAIDRQFVLVPELRLRWLHEFGDTDRALRARFLSAPVPGGFALSGAEAPRDALLAGLGWAGELSDRVAVHADYDAWIDAERVDHRLAIAVHLSF